MAWQEIAFERQALYERVWTTAVSRLAKEYGLSDVGLRKICDRLAVPVPPLGHWAKVAHGKPSPQTPLPPFDGEATYVHRKWLDEADAARHAKVDSAIAAAPAPSVTITFRDDPSDWHPVVRRTLRSFRKPTIGNRGLYWTAEPECFRATVGSESRPRAMRFLDALWGALAQLGAKTVPGKEGRRHLLVELDGQAMLLAVTESTRRVERELTVEERRRLKQNEHAYISDRHQYVPTGQLALVLSTAAGWERRRFRDGRQPIEAQLSAILDAVRMYAIEAAILAQEAEEERKRSEAAERRRSELRSIAEVELKRLRTEETAAVQWERAERLRRFAEAIERLSPAGGSRQSAPPRVAERVAWLRHVADWLDPLAHHPWPEVDGADAPYWWRDYQQKHGAVQYW